MAKRPSLSHQFWKVMESKKCFGESRHSAKIIAKEQGRKVEGIYSYKTYDAYKQSSKKFCKWIKSEYPNIKNIDEIDKEVCIKYIKHLEQLNYSAYTYSQSMSMISKILNISLTKKECNVRNRSLKNIKNSRVNNGFKGSNKITTIIKGTGLRRNELEHLEVKNLITSLNCVTGIKISKGAKGGKSRIVEVRKEFQKTIYKLVEGLGEDSKVIMEQIPRQLQTHRYRAEYAQNMYIELQRLGRKDPLKDLTESMGHNRISILTYYGVNPNKKTKS